MGKNIITVISVLFLAMVFCGTASAAEWNVTPGQSIQGAINNAADNDIITVKDSGGTGAVYNENVVVNKKNLTIRANGNVTVHTPDPIQSVFDIGSSGSGSTIQGFTLTGQNDGLGWGAIYMSQVTGCNIIGNTFTDNLNSMALIMSSNNLINANSGTGVIYLGDSSYNTISNNNGLPVSLFGSNNNNITQNNIDGLYESSIILDNSSSNKIANNTLKNSAYGMFIQNSSNNNNITINTIKDINGDGISVIDSSGNIITNNQFTNSGTADGSVSAITLWQSSNNQVRNNTIVEGGINLYGSNEAPTTGNTIENNDISGHLNGPGDTMGNGINLSVASGNTINGNYIHDNQGNGIEIAYSDYYGLSSDHNQITFNNITDNGGIGINNWCSNNNTISNNNITNNGVINEWGSGINIVGNHDQGIYSEENQVNNNYVTGNRNFGINLSDAHNNTVNGNTIENNGWGFEYWAELKLYFANNNIISNNIIFNNFDDHGISMDNASGNQIFNNQITNATRGIDIYYQSNNNQFTCNTVTNSKEIGIYARESTGNTFISNQMSGGSSRLQIREDPGVLIDNNNISNLDWSDPFYQQSGIDLGESPGSFILNNILTNTGGISLWASDGTLIGNNTLINCTTQGISLQKSSATIIGNTLINSGINLAASPECTLTNNNITTTSSEIRTLEVQTWNDDINDFRQYIDTSNTINGKPTHYILDANNLLIDNTWIIGYLALVQCNNVTLHGINMNNTGRGIFLAGTNSSTIGGYLPGEACNFTNNDVGIELWQSYDNQIINNMITDNQQGIVIRSNTGNANNTLDGNILINNIEGISINKSGMNNLSNNDITSNSPNARNFGVGTWGDDSGDDSNISDFRQNIDTSNTINGKAIYYIMDASDLIIDNSWNLGFLGLVQCNNITITGLNMTNNGQGIMLAGTTNSTIGGYLPGEACNFEDNNQGVFLFGSSGNHIIKNQVLDNTHPNGQTGIDLAQNSDHNTIISNYLSGNDSGIGIMSSSYNTIQNNLLINNIYSGIEIGGEAGEVSDFYTGGVNNIIINNTINGGKYSGVSIANSPNDQIINNTITNTCNTTDTWDADWDAAIVLRGTNSTLVYGNQILNNHLSGILISDMDWQDAYSENNQIFSNNISGNLVGIRVDSDTTTNTINFNRIVGNNECQLRYNGGVNTLNAVCNWWGSNSAPVNGPGEQIEGLVNFSPWLVLNLTSNQTTMRPNSAVNITADLTHDQNGVYYNPTTFHIPNGITVLFTTTMGTINNPKTTTNGIANTILNIGSVSGIVDVSATVDNQIVHKQITIDNTAPYVSSIDPKNNAVNVAANKVIKITFTEDIKAGNPNLIQLKNSAGTLITTTKTIAGKVLSITPTSALAESRYMLLLYASYVTDLAGNPATAKTYNFIVGTSPTVTSIDPANYAVNVAADKIINITFNEPIKAGNNNIQLKTNTGTLIPTTITISGNTLTITPTSPLAESRYVILIYAGSVTDLAGNPVAAKTSSFSTGISPNVTSTDPANYATNVPTNKIITVTFNEPIEGKYLTLVQLKNATTGLLINTTKTVSGNTLIITPTNALTANTRYLLMIYRYAVVDLVGNPNNSKSISFTTGTTY